MSEIRSKPASQEYRDNWDRVFGRKADGGPVPEGEPYLVGSQPCVDLVPLPEPRGQDCPENKTEREVPS